ncbi:MAG: hypothetical protein U5J98_04635 [Halobacteriales archaeon]|nr:hypothetical protein [Halobacteriales archaeon]
MNRTHVIGGILVVLVLAMGLGWAVYSGVGPAPGGTDSGEPLTDFPTATPGDDSSSTGESGPTATAEPPFAFTIDAVEECGQTCRDVTASLHNNQDESATGTTVFTRVFAGQDNTDTDDLVWEGKEEVGTLDAGATHTATRRVELSLQDGLKIDQHDGWITIVTTVQTDERTVTFRDSEQVA